MSFWDTVENVIEVGSDIYLTRESAKAREDELRRQADLETARLANARAATVTGAQTQIAVAESNKTLYLGIGIIGAIMLYSVVTNMLK